MLFLQEEYRIDKSKFIVDHRLIQNTFDFYASQYLRVVEYLHHHALNGNYFLNCRALPYLFLVRHSIELELKNRIINNGDTVAFEHNITRIIQDYPTVFAPHIINDIPALFLEGDGSELRYYTQKKGQINSLLYKKIEFLPEVLKLNNLFHDTFLDQSKITKKAEWEFTFHLTEVRGRQIFRTQYDNLIGTIIQDIDKGNININDIVLPFLFLLRHSIELGIKNCLIEVLHFVKEEEIKNKLSETIDNEHSLERLFNKYESILNSLDLTKLDSETKKRYDELLEKLNKIKSKVHVLDSNSQSFRYLVVNVTKIPLNKVDISEIIELFIEVDIFLTHAVDLLKFEGIVEFSDDDLAALYNI